MNFLIRTTGVFIWSSISLPAGFEHPLTNRTSMAHSLIQQPRS
jgi:hypothetical protein